MILKNLLEDMIDTAEELDQFKVMTDILNTKHVPLILDALQNSDDGLEPRFIHREIEQKYNYLSYNYKRMSDQNLHHILRKLKNGGLIVPHGKGTKKYVLTKEGKLMYQIIGQIFSDLTKHRRVQWVGNVEIKEYDSEFLRILREVMVSDQDLADQDHMPNSSTDSKDFEIAQQVLMPSDFARNWKLSVEVKVRKGIPNLTVLVDTHLEERQLKVTYDLLVTMSTAYLIFIHKISQRLENKGRYKRFIDTLLKGAITTRSVRRRLV